MTFQITQTFKNIIICRSRIGLRRLRTDILGNTQLFGQLVDPAKQLGIFFLQSINLIGESFVIADDTIQEFVNFIRIITADLVFELLSKISLGPYWMLNFVSLLLSIPTHLIVFMEPNY